MFWSTFQNPEAEALFETMKAKEFRIHPDILQKAIGTIKEM